MLTISDNPKEQDQFERIAAVRGELFAYGVMMADMTQNEAVALVSFALANGLTECPPADTLDQYFNVPIDMTREEDDNAR